MLHREHLGVFRVVLHRQDLGPEKKRNQFPEGSGMEPMHILKLALGVGVFFTGLQLGMDIATKVLSMTTTKTPASS